jgi:hypothetical protein
MKSLILIPHRFKIFGWILLLLTTLLHLSKNSFELPRVKVLVLNIYIHYSEILSLFSFEENDIKTTLVIAGYSLGSLIIICSKEKIEDEFISILRLNSLLWAFVLNNVAFIFLTLTVYGTEYLSIIAWNPYTTSFLYITIFHFMLIKNSYYSYKNGK